MVFALWGFVYLLVGLSVAGFTTGVFPPVSGYRAPMHWRVIALTTYVVLWPFLVMIGVGYLLGRRQHMKSYSYADELGRPYQGSPRSQRVRKSRTAKSSQDFQGRGIRYQAIYEDTLN